ncbi:S-norcoclaurine synthase 1-like [Quercus lobata]|uniref:S-norcoclaurine synthase 1-like n=1 Tax=Quercus lobata TaxID=97700 RepID=UPI00124477F0|nr:S-norcoclaurine synthase 1-like [Quercus lobata]
MFGQLSHELGVNVPASEAWELYSALRLAKLVEEEPASGIEKIDVIEGDGGAGTILKLTFAGPPLFTVYKEKFTKLDNEKRLKETEVVEGGYLELGFTLFLIRFEVIEKDNDSCIIKSTIEYDVKEEAAANASYFTIDAVANIAELSKNYLTKNKAAKDEH